MGWIVASHLGDCRMSNIGVEERLEVKALMKYYD